MRWLNRLEPLWWTLFAVGGTVAAFLVPVHVFINIAVPLGWLPADTLDHNMVARLVQNPMVKFYLVVLLVTTFYHSAHRLSILPHELLLPLPRRATPLVVRLIITALAVAALIAVIVAP
jgi:fumarate reductase subunit D